MNINHDTNYLLNQINIFWNNKDNLSEQYIKNNKIKSIIKEVFALMEMGKITSCYKNDVIWQVNISVKKAILLYFKITQSKIFHHNDGKWIDKLAQKSDKMTEEELINSKIRLVPGCYVREASFIGENVVVMPSFINVGAYVDDGTLIDSWATVGSLARIGKNCHISGGAGIGGVLEPLQANPVIIEDNCFIGARSEIVEGVIVREGAVISMGCFIGASTKIVDRATGEITYGEIPAYSVVVPGTLPNPNSTKDKILPSLNCVVIIKKVDKKTRKKTAINELLRNDSL